MSASITLPPLCEKHHARALAQVRPHAGHADAVSMTVNLLLFTVIAASAARQRHGGDRTPVTERIAREIERVSCLGCAAPVPFGRACRFVRRRGVAHAQAVAGGKRDPLWPWSMLRSGAVHGEVDS